MRCVNRYCVVVDPAQHPEVQILQFRMLLRLLRTSLIVGIIAKIAALKTKKFSAGYVHMNSISTGVYQCTGCIKHGDFKLLYRVRRI